MFPLFAGFLGFFLFLGAQEAAGAVEAQTAQDHDTGHVKFLFDNEPSLQIAKRASETAGMSCSSAEEGAIRYNSYLKNLEFCNGSVWSVPGGAKTVTVNYAACTYAYHDPDTTSLDSYYMQFGGPYASNTNLACPQNYVLVALDDVEVITAFCCPLKLQ